MNKGYLKIIGGNKWEQRSKMEYDRIINDGNSCVCITLCECHDKLFESWNTTHLILYPDLNIVNYDNNHIFINVDPVDFDSLNCSMSRSYINVLKTKKLLNMLIDFIITLKNSNNYIYLLDRKKSDIISEKLNGLIDSWDYVNTCRYCDETGTHNLDDNDYNDDYYCCVHRPDKYVLIQNITNLILNSYTDMVDCYLCGINVLIQKCKQYKSCHCNELLTILEDIVKNDKPKDEILNMIVSIRKQNSIYDDKIKNSIGCDTCFDLCYKTSIDDMIKYYSNKDECKLNSQYWESGKDWKVCCKCEMKTCNHHFIFDQHGDICHRCMGIYHSTFYN